MNREVNVVRPVVVSATDLVNILRITANQLEEIQDELLKQQREKEMNERTQRMLDKIERRRAINLAVWEYEQEFACVSVNPLFLMQTPY